MFIKFWWGLYKYMYMILSHRLNFLKWYIHIYTHKDLELAAYKTYFM